MRVIKHIVVHNLYGVDIEKQATEIAKLRLFLAGGCWSRVITSSPFPISTSTSATATPWWAMSMLPATVII